MLQVYLNYPNPKIHIHGLANCSEIGKMQKHGRRSVLIDRNSISSELQNFALKNHRFAAEASANDMWLVVDFGDPHFEDAVVRHVQRLIAGHYSPFGAVQIDRHC